MKMTLPPMARNVTIVTCAPELKGGLHAVGGLAELRTLALGDAEALRTLPMGLGKLRNLETLDLDGCPGLATAHERPARAGGPARASGPSATGNRVSASAGQALL